MLPCVDVFVADEFCVWATILQMCLALRWGAQLADLPCDAFGRPSCGRALRCVGVPKLGEAVLKSLPPSGRALRCIGAPNLRMCRRALRFPCGRELGTQLADVPCVALGRPTLVRL